MLQRGSEPAPASGADRRPEAIRRSMARTMTAAAVILVAVISLAVAAGWMALRAGQHQERAEAAELRGKIQVWHSYLDQAGTHRMHGSQGRRVDGMESLRQAVRGFHSVPGGTMDDVIKLRDEAAALLALDDAGAETGIIPVPGEHSILAVAPAHDLFAEGRQDVTPDGTAVTVRRLTDGSEVARLKLNGKYEKKLLLTSLSWCPPVAAAPGQARLAAQFKNGEMAMWSLPSGDLCLEGHTEHGSLMSGGGIPWVFSPEGRYFGWFSSNEGPLRIYDFTTASWLPNPIATARCPFSFRPGGTQIAIVSGLELRVLNLSTGAVSFRRPLSAAVNTLTWDPAGRQIAAMTGTGLVLLWSFDNTGEYTLAGHTAPTKALQFSPDGRTLMSSSQDGTTRWWDTGRGQLLLKSQAGFGLAYTPDGKEVICETSGHAIARWPVLPAPVMHNLTMSGGRNWESWGFDLSTDGKWFATMTPAGIEVWDLDRLPLPAALFGAEQILGGPQLLRNVMGRKMLFTSLTFAPDGTMLITVDGQILRRRLAWRGNAVVLEPAELPEVPLPKSVNARSAMVSADGRRLLVELTNNQAGVADMEGVQPFVMLRRTQTMTFNFGPGSPAGAGRMVLSGDGKWVAFGYGMNLGLTVFDAWTGRETLVQDSGSLVLFSPDSSRLLVCRTREALLLDTAGWKPLASRSCPGLSHVGSGGAFSGDGRLLALTSRPQVTELCEGTSLTKHLTLQAPSPQNIRGLRMTRDGSRLAVVTGSNEVQLWNVAALRRELSALGLDWNDSAPPPPGSTAVIAPAPATTVLPGLPAWTLAAGLAAAALAAAAAAVFLLRRHRGLLDDYKEAETLVAQQRADLDRANAGLFHSEKMKSLGTLAAGMAHDFNNLLSVIRMSGKLIARETGGQESVSEHTATIESAVLQGKQVVRSILGYSRSGEAEAGTRSAAAIVEDAVVLLSTEFLSGITLTLQLDRGTPEVAAAPDRVEQMLLNLIINASEAMGGRGSLAIAVHTAEAGPPDGFILPPTAPGPWVEICVRDSGPGVPPELARRIFEPFFTTKNAGNQRGTGLGLSMVHTFAVESGAGIALQSAPGQGAAFSIFLPTVRETPAAQSGAPH